jgi:hypothetical protein
MIACMFCDVWWLFDRNAALDSNEFWSLETVETELKYRSIIVGMLSITGRCSKGHHEMHVPWRVGGQASDVIGVGTNASCLRFHQAKSRLHQPLHIPSHVLNISVSSA